MKNILYIILVVLIIFSSCTKKFTEINTDPDNLEVISPGTLLNPLIYEVATFNFLRAESFTFDIMQVAQPFPATANALYNYNLSETTGNSTWNAYYRWMNNAKEIFEQADRINDRNYKAIALTLNAWMLSNLTDCFGDVPITEALQGEQGVLFPAYDTQQSVYTKILNDLKTADTLFDAGQPLRYSKDILYGAYQASDAETVLKWRKFCNSLRLRSLLKLRRRTEMHTDAELINIIGNPEQYPVFDSNEDAAVLKITGEVPNVSPFGRAIDFTVGRALNNLFADLLNRTNDPRASLMMNQAKSKNGDIIGYKGLPAGYEGDGNNLDFIPSNFNTRVVTAPMIAPILPYAEIAFIKAELAQKGLVMLDAAEEYEKGVQAAIEMWGGKMPENFFDNDFAKYNGTLQRIMEQKYLSLLFVDYQQWIEYRRTGFPQIQLASTTNNFPVRFQYPPTQKVTNRENYELAVQSIGGDATNIKVWWEK